MSNFTKKEFADLCGMTSRKLAIYIGRGKVIASKKGYIDDKNPINALFRAKNNAAGVEVKEVLEKKEKKKEGEMPSLDVDRETLVSLEVKKKMADLEKTEGEIRLQKIKEEKLLGNTMPVELVKTIVANLSKSFISEFKNGADDIIRILIKTKEFNHDEISELRGSMATIINGSMKKTLQIAKKEMKAIAENYSEIKGVGEHE